MAKGDTVAGLSSVNAAATKTIQPGAGIEWIVHNIYHEDKAKLHVVEGTNELLFGAAAAKGSWSAYFFHLSNSHYLKVENDVDAAAMLGAVADDGGSQTDETAEANNTTANNMVLLPAAPTVEDAYYFGSDLTFNILTLNIGTAGAGTWTITWEYWNGSAWTACNSISDGTSGFTAAAGNHNVTHTPQSNWAKNTISSINAYWIRGRVSAYTSITTQPKGTQSWIYNCKLIGYDGIVSKE